MYLLLGAQDQPLDAGQDHLSRASTGNSSGNCQRDGNLQSSGVSHATTASPKPCFRAPWRVGVVVGKGNAGWTISKREHPFSCQNCSQRSPAEKTGRGSLLNRPSCPPDDPVCQGNELNWTELYKVARMNASPTFNQNKSMTHFLPDTSSSCTRVIYKKKLSLERSKWRSSFTSSVTPSTTESDKAPTGKNRLWPW